MSKYVCRLCGSYASMVHVSEAKRTASCRCGYAWDMVDGRWQEGLE